jgi:ankyrin repeat protein
MIAFILSWLLLTTPLIDAVKQNDEAAVRALLQKHADVNAREGDGATALHWAVYADHEAIARVLVTAGADVNAANDLAITPLYLASVNGNAAIARLLTDNGARVDAASETGVTPLMEAARVGSVDTVRVLVDRGADVNHVERDRGQTALMWAVARKHPAVVKLLLDRRADIQVRTRVRSLRVMLDQGPRRAVKTSAQDARQIDAGGSTALLLAAQVGDAESAALLLAGGADVNDTGADGNSALTLAAFSGHPAIARVLLDGGADPNRAAAGYTALHAAALRGDLATVQALLSRGADPNARITKGSPVRRFGSQWALPTPLTGATPLLVAAAYLEVDIMRALVAAKANLTLALANGTTPLLATAGIPVEKEVRPSDLERWNVVDSDTPAIPRDEGAVIGGVRLLLDAGASVAETTDSGDTALHAAAAAGATNLIELLVDRGAVLEVTNRNGQTPLAMTQVRGRQQDEQTVARLQSAEALLRTLGARK